VKSALSGLASEEWVGYGHGQGQDHRGPKVAKMANFKVSISYAVMHVINRLTVNYDPRQCLNFNWTGF